MWTLIPDTQPASECAGRPEVRRGRRVAVAHTERGVWLGYLGGTLRLSADEAGAASHAQGPQRGKPALSGTQRLRAPMAGRIVMQHAVVGARCTRGETLVVLEAMKMEYKMCAPADGRITTSHGAAGDAVTLDAVLVTLVCDAPG